MCPVLQSWITIFTSHTYIYIFFFNSEPYSETAAVFLFFFQGRHITMRPAFTVWLRTPQANWTPHKASDNCCPPLCVFLRALFIRCWMQQRQWMKSRGGGGTMKGGCIIEWWWRWGGGHSPKPHKNSRTIFNRVERSFSHLPGFQGFSVLTGRQEGSDRTAPFLPAAFKASFPLTHHATPRLISVTSTTEGQGFFFSRPLPFFSTLKLPFSRVEKTFVFFSFWNHYFSLSEYKSNFKQA